MIQLAVFDVDGTLLSHKNFQVPQSAVEAIRKLRKQGIQVAICSGRPAYALGCLFNAGVEVDYIVGCNGHCVYRGTDELIAAVYFEEKTVQELTDFCIENDYPLTWKFEKANYFYNKMEEFDYISKAHTLTEDRLYKCYERNHHNLELPFGAATFIPQHKVDVYIKKHPDVQFVPFAPDRYDVILKKVDKTTGLDLLLKEIGLTFDECIAFGDGANDYEMLSKSGISVAMKECHPSLLDICDYHTDDCLEDGIYKALKYYQLID